MYILQYIQTKAKVQLLNDTTTTTTTTTTTSGTDKYTTIRIPFPHQVTERKQLREVVIAMANAATSSIKTRVF